MIYLIAALVGYLFGCFQTAYLMGVYLKKTDIRKHGSTNAGATNVMLVFGWKYGLVTAFVDIFKTILAIAFIAYFFPDHMLARYIAGLFCIVGHMFPFYIQFKGGKGFASYVGLILANNWRLGVLTILLCILVLVIFDKIALSALFATSFYPVYQLFTRENPIVVTLLFLMFFLVSYKHKANIQRLRAGTEPGLRDYIRLKQTAK
jgi:glycerol-3-phosphate acyltransferase PlsY